MELKPCPFCGGDAMITENYVGEKRIGIIRAAVRLVSCFGMSLAKKQSKHGTGGRVIERY